MKSRDKSPWNGRMKWMEERNSIEERNQWNKEIESRW